MLSSKMFRHGMVRRRNIAPCMVGEIIVPIQLDDHDLG